MVVKKENATSIYHPDKTSLFHVTVLNVYQTGIKFVLLRKVVIAKNHVDNQSNLLHVQKVNKFQTFSLLGPTEKLLIIPNYVFNMLHVPVMLNIKIIVLLNNVKEQNNTKVV